LAATVVTEAFHNKQETVLSLEEPHDAAVNFDAYRILQRHRIREVTLPATAQTAFFWPLSADCNESSVKK